MSNYIDECEKRFGELATNTGFCEQCPYRGDFLQFMAEENPSTIPTQYTELGKLARSQCDGTSVTPDTCLGIDDEPPFDEVVEYSSELERLVDIHGVSAVQSYLENQQRKVVPVPGYGAAIRLPLKPKDQAS